QGLPLGLQFVDFLRAPAATALAPTAPPAPAGRFAIIVGSRAVVVAVPGAIVIQAVLDLAIFDGSDVILLAGVAFLDVRDSAAVLIIVVIVVIVAALVVVIVTVFVAIAFVL